MRHHCKGYCRMLGHTAKNWLINGLLRCGNCNRAFSIHMVGFNAGGAPQCPCCGRSLAISPSRSSITKTNSPTHARRVTELYEADR